MSGLVRALILGLAIIGIAVESDPVRRTSKKNSPSDMHCVVWGDGPYFGRKFDNEKDADSHFQRVKRDELVAIHYDKRFREVQRFKSPRVKAVTWHRLADWCKEDHEETPSSLEAGPKLEIGVGAKGTLSEELMEQTSKQASLLATDSESLEAYVKPRQLHGHHAEDADPTSDVSSLKGRSPSNLIGKVSAIEAELALLTPKAKNAFDTLGMKNYVGALSLGSKDKSKLKIRVTSLDNFIAGLADNVQSLEEEFLGSVTSSLATQTEGSSLKAKVDSMEVKVDNLKKRLLALDASEVIAELPKLEERVVSSSSKILAMFKNLGYPEGAARAFTINPNEPFKQRMTSLGQAAVLAQRSTKTLGYEMLEHSWEAVAMPKVKGTKAEIEALAGLVDDLQKRVSELESAPLQKVIDKAEHSLSQLQAKAVELSKRIGSEAPSAMLEMDVADASFKGRIQHIENLASSVESKFVSLENELLGGSKASSKSLANTQSMKGRAMALEVKVDSLTSRAVALEQEV